MIEPVRTWPSEECRIVPEFEPLVTDIYEMAYVDARHQLREEKSQDGSYRAKLSAKSRAERADGVEVVGHGAGRLTLAGDLLTSDAHVLKVAQYSPTEKEGFAVEGLAQNEMEATTWADVPETIRPWFTPVTAADNEYRWVIQPRVDATTPLPEGDATSDHVAAHVQQAGWLAVELNTTNLGLRDGGVAIYDYGLPIRSKDWFAARRE